MGMPKKWWTTKNAVADRENGYLKLFFNFYLLRLGIKFDKDTGFLLLFYICSKRKGKLSERIGSKTFGLSSSLGIGRLSFDKKSNDQRLKTNDEYGGWVTEIERVKSSFCSPSTLRPEGSSFSIGGIGYMIGDFGETKTLVFLSPNYGGCYR